MRMCVLQIACKLAVVILLGYGIFFLFSDVVSLFLLFCRYGNGQYMTCDQLRDFLQDENVSATMFFFSCGQCDGCVGTIGCSFFLFFISFVLVFLAYFL